MNARAPLLRVLWCAIASLAFSACSPNEADGDAGHDDAGIDDAGPNDAGPDDAGPRDGGSEEPELENPWGFSMRKPGEHTLPCDTQACGSGSTVALDKDYVCTLSIDGHDAVVYVRATPTGIDELGFWPVPLYEDVRAFVAEDGQVREVPAAYDYGGNHHNDFFHITLDGVRYTWDHSSYGYGFRQCQPPDCLKREEGASYTDGCQPERTLPEACIAVTDPLPPLVDNFARCPGDEP